MKLDTYNYFTILIHSAGKNISIIEFIIHCNQSNYDLNLLILPFVFLVTLFAVSLNLSTWIPGRKLHHPINILNTWNIYRWYDNTLCFLDTSVGPIAISVIINVDINKSTTSLRKNLEASGGFVLFATTRALPWTGVGGGGLNAAPHSGSATDSNPWKYYANTIRQ